MTHKPQKRFKNTLLNTTRAASLGRPLDMMALEPRILLDAAGFVTGAELAADAVLADAAVAPIELNDTRLNFSPEQIAELTAALKDTVPVMEDLSDDELITATSAGGAALYVVDSAVQGYEQLIEGLPEGADILIIGKGEDGLSLLAEALADRESISELHILSHGEAGELRLGTAVLTADTIAGEHADELAVIRDAMSVSGDILIYGCDFGQDADAMAALAQATGADIAASDDDPWIRRYRKRRCREVSPSSRSDCRWHYG